MTDLIKLLQNCPKGRELYCTAVGVIQFIVVDCDKIKFKTPNERFNVTTEVDGRVVKNENVECIIFPSYKCRDWKLWAEVLVKDGDIVLHKSGRVVRFDHRSHDYDDIVRFASEEEAKEQSDAKTDKPFQPFDKVIVCDGNTARWVCAFFSHIRITANGMRFAVAGGFCYRYCLPFDGNEHLVGQQFSEKHIK